jgi:predicted nuclease of predicted toxin-antitoxin system
MKFLVDMNLSPSWVAFLAEAGFDAVHWSTVGASFASDRELMEWAAERDHVVLTNDLDFGAILAALGGVKPSVIQLRSELLTPGAIGAAVLAAVRQAERELTAGAIVSVDASNARIRVLPLAQ